MLPILFIAWLGITQIHGVAKPISQYQIDTPADIQTTVGRNAYQNTINGYKLQGN
jgi:hypothetical protein